MGFRATLNFRKSMSWNVLETVLSHLKSPLNTQEAILIVKSTRHLVKGWISDCYRRLNYSSNKLQQQLDKLKQLIPTNLLDTVMTIAERRAEKKTTHCVRTE